MSKLGVNHESIITYPKDMSAEKIESLVAAPVPYWHGKESEEKEV